MSEQDELHNKIVNFFTRSRAIQNTSGAQRNDWLRQTGLDDYIVSAKLNVDDGASEFSNKLIGKLWNSREDLLTFLEWMADNVYGGNKNGDGKYDDIKQFISAIKELPDDVEKTTDWGVDQFLQNHGILLQWGDPFDTRAESYAKDFPRLFYNRIRLYNRRNQLTESYSALKRLPNLFLFAPEGYGKTAIRLMLAHDAREERNPPDLVVETDVEALDEHILANEKKLKDNLRRHLIRQVLSTLNNQLTELDKKRPSGRSASVSWQTLRKNQSAIAQFIALTTVFGIAVPISDTPPAEMVKDAVEQFKRDLADGLQLSHWMDVLWRIANAAGFRSIHLIVDGLEAYLRENYDQQQELIRPLLKPRLIGPPNNIYYWKFFLRKPLDAVVQSELNIDVVPCYYISPWTAEDLIAMLDRRLDCFSRVGNVSQNIKLSSLCESDTDEELKELVGYADGSPRKFVQIIKELCETHVHSTTDQTALISRETLQQHIRYYRGPQRGA